MEHTEWDVTVSNDFICILLDLSDALVLEDGELPVNFIRVTDWSSEGAGEDVALNNGPLSPNVFSEVQGDVLFILDGLQSKL